MLSPKNVPENTSQCPFYCLNPSGQFCDICGKEFRGKNSTVTYNLKRHKNSVHLHLRPFQCRRFPCQKMFGEKRNRDQHEKTVHDRIRKTDMLLRPSFTMTPQTPSTLQPSFPPALRPSFPPPPPFTKQSPFAPKALPQSDPPS